MTWISFTVLGWLLPPQPLLAIGRLPTAPLESTFSQLSWSAYQELSLQNPGGLKMVRSVLCLKVEMSSIYATLSGKRPTWSSLLSVQGPSTDRRSHFQGLLLPTPAPPLAPLSGEKVCSLLSCLLDGILARIKNWLSHWEQLRCSLPCPILPLCLATLWFCFANFWTWPQRTNVRGLLLPSHHSPGTSAYTC